jgi:CRP-like cAMP-binding protein
MANSNLTKERQVPAGGVIYRAGDPGNAVYVLQEGEVEILRETGGETQRVAVLRRGAIFGEMGVLRNKPRSTTVRALSETRMIALSKDDFLDSFGGENSLALPLLRMLCDRLSQAGNYNAAHQISTNDVRPHDVGRMRLLPASSNVEAQIGGDGIEISELPFRIGRHALADDRTSASETELLLRAPGSMQISPEHLIIQARDGRIVLRDLGSQVGTIVNGVLIAHFEQTDEVTLQFGDNEVQLGGLDSPYRFRIIIERVDEDEAA